MGDRPDDLLDLAGQRGDAQEDAFQIKRQEAPAEPRRTLPGRESIHLNSADVDASLASSGQRLIHYIVDAVFIILVAVILIVVVGEAIAPYAGFLGFVLYYLALEWLLGMTVAKLITRTRVVSENGRRPSFFQVLGRTACRLIPFEPFSFLGGDAIGWHDKLPRTRVISTRYVADE